MTGIDWAVLVATIGAIVGVGIWRTRHVRDFSGYIRGSGELPWYTIGLSVMATQASAITFLSTPGQGFVDGMRFVQFYFGLPIAMVILCAKIVPGYYRLNVYTAYEYLESRFDLKTRLLAALLFMLQRGLSAGVTIYAPAIILSSVLGWSLQATNVAVGVLVIVYTVAGGTRAVSQTQKHQMVVILAGMAVAFGLLVARLPDFVSFGEALHLAGALDRMKIVDFSLDPNNRYTFWSGITGGLFLALSYFGTDQSQVQRYISGGSLTQSRLGLLFNGLVKVPMQFLILLAGVVLFVFYLFEPSPVFFNGPALEAARRSHRGAQVIALQDEYQQLWRQRRAAAGGYLQARQHGDRRAQRGAREALRRAQREVDGVRGRARAAIRRAVPRAETEDADYVFISFVLGFVPAGLVGLLLAVILSAAMSSTASELNALAATTVVDFYRRLRREPPNERQLMAVSKLSTVLWGGLAILFATLASLVDNLIEAVNILGSLFYGTILGMFALAFFSRRVSGTPVFVAAILSELAVVALFVFSDVGFLWYNVVGCALVVALAALSPTRP